MIRKYSALHVRKILRIEEMVTLRWIRLLHWVQLKHATQFPMERYIRQEDQSIVKMKRQHVVHSRIVNDKG